MIDSLTDEQKAMVPVWLKKYRDIGLSTELSTNSLSQLEVFSIVDDLYDFLGRDKPIKIYVDSPYLMLMSYGIMKVICNKECPINIHKSFSDDQLWGQLSDQLWEQLQDQLRSQLWGQFSGQLSDQLRDYLWGQLDDQLSDQLGGQLWGQLSDQLREQLWEQLQDQLDDQFSDQLWSQLWSQLGGQLWAQLRGQLIDQLWGQLSDQLGGQLWDQFSDQLREQLRDQFSDQLSDQLWAQLRGQLRGQLWAQFSDQLRDKLRGQVGNIWWCQYYAYYVCFYDFLSKIADIGDKSKNIQLANDMLNLGMILPYGGIVFISKRPFHIHINENGDIHCDNDLAVKYKDGWGMACWRGIRIPEWYVLEKEKITIKTIQEEKNAEYRRIQLEIFGIDRYLKETKARCLDKSSYGELYKINSDPEDLVFVKVKNSTAEPDGSFKDYFLSVPPNMKRAHEAVAWTFGLEEFEYCPEMET